MKVDTLNIIKKNQRGTFIPKMKVIQSKKNYSRNAEKNRLRKEGHHV